MEIIPADSNQVERIFSAIQNLKELQGADKTHFDRLCRFKEMLLDGYTENQSLKLIKAEFEISDRLAYTIRDNCFWFFGRIDSSVLDEGRKRIFLEGLLLKAQKAKDREDFAIEQRYLIEYAKMAGYYKDGEDTIDPASLIMPIQINIHNDIKLKNKNERNKSLPK